MPSAAYPWQRRSLSRRAYLIIAAFISAVIILPYSYSSIKHFNGQTPAHSTVNPIHRSKEVYMTLLCPGTPHPAANGGIDYYFEATRILAYRLLHKSFTKDLQNRPLIVLATQDVLPEQIRALESDGAIVRQVSAIAPPKGTDLTKINQQWKDQYTKLIILNMTEYTKVLYIDADILPVRPLSAVFDTPVNIDHEGDPYLFAAAYDSAYVRDNGHYTRPMPTLGPDDTHAFGVFNAGLFLVHPSHKQADYVQDIYDNPVEGQDFTGGMEQDLLRYAYRDAGEFPWTRLSQMYNTQWPRLEDLEVSHAVHDKMWKDDSPVQWDLRRFWYVAWGEMRGWADTRAGH
jgi:alpha-N-acetylglucosamine transferase